VDFSKIYFSLFDPKTGGGSHDLSSEAWERGGSVDFDMSL